MLNEDGMNREIEHISKIINEVELAMALEDDQETKIRLKSANGQLKAARSWLIRIMKDRGWVV